MGQESLTIVTENQQNVFYPGQTLSGLLHVELDETIKAKEIQMRFKGKGFCFWTEGGGQNTRYYHARETYCLETQILYGKAIEFPTVGLTIGGSRYLFKTYPSCGLRVSCQSKGSGENTGTKTICCLCCESNPITASVRTERKGYVPGDTIVFNAEINNMSGRSIKRSKGQLTMVVTLIASGKRHDYVNKLAKIKHGPIEPGGSDVYRNEQLTIPPVPPSYLLGCNIIDIKYYVSIIAFTSGPSLNLRVHSEVVIGTIPLSGVASQYGLTLPTNLGIPAAPSGLYSDTASSSIPQASLAESMFGKAGIGVKKKKKGDNADASSGFVPVYIYYKWNQQNPADLFTVSR